MASIHFPWMPPSYASGNFHSNCGSAGWFLPFNTPKKGGRSLFTNNSPWMYNTRFSIMFEFVTQCDICAIGGPFAIRKFYTGMAHCPSRAADKQTCHFEARQ